MFTAGDHDFENLVKRDDIDFVYTATPWPWHTPVALAAMKAGKHVGTEVPVAMSLDQCWELVDTSEKTRRHCLMMENCCYDFNEMLVNTMVKQGLFGEILYAEAAYIHDLRALLFEDKDEGLWRRLPHTNRQGNFYPTHGLGPVAWYLDIHKGDRFDYPRLDVDPGTGALTLARGAHPQGLAQVAGDLCRGRHQHLVHQDRTGQDHPAHARGHHAHPVRSPELGARHQGCLQGLPGALLHRGPARRRWQAVW